MGRTLRVLVAVAATAGLAAVPTVTGAQRAPRVTCTNESVLSTWSLPALIRQEIVVPVEASQIASAGPLFRAGYGGVILFGATAPTNFATVLASLKATEPNAAGVFVMTDDEGGGVWRLSNLLTPLPWARAMATKYTPTRITAIATHAATQMAALGINMDLAPVLDIDGTNAWPSATNADGYRSFSGNATVVASDGVAFMKGLAAGGVVPVIKHFPGLGGVSPNTDDGAASTKSWTTVEATSLAPFRAAINAGAPALMMSNATVPGLTTGPATLSAAAYSAVRHTLGFTGLILTDSLSAGAITATHESVPTASTNALEAGAQMVLFGLPATGSTAQLANEIVESVFAAVADHSLSRATLLSDATEILATRDVNLCPPPS